MDIDGLREAFHHLPGTGSLISFAMMRPFRFVRQNVARLTIKHPTYCFQGGESNCFGTTILQDGDIGWREPYSFSKFTNTHVSFCEKNI